MRGMLFSLLLLPALASAQSKDAIDVTWHAPLRPLLQGMPGVGDLAPDPGFAGGSGFIRLDFNDVNGKRDQGLRIFPVDCGFFCEQYLVLGAHAHGGGWDAVITRINPDGSVDTDFGNNGRFVVPTPLDFINDAAMDPDGTHLYFAGMRYMGASSSYDFAVTCVAVDGTPCAGFGIDGTVTQGFDLGSHRSDIAQRIVYQRASGAHPAGLFLGGVAIDGSVAAPSTRIGVMALDPASGNLRSGFGNAGKLLPPFGSIVDDAKAGVFDMALSQPSMPGGERVYVAGVYKRNAGDDDGYILALDPDTGAFAASFHTVPIFVHNDIGPPGNLYDAVSAIAVQPDGKVVMAGMSTNATSHDQLLLARMNPLGGFDSGFCGGGVCTHESFIATDVVPRAIAVRPMTRDLVIAMESIYSPPGESARTVQHVEQYGASGNTLHGATVVEYASNPGEGPSTSPRALLVSANLQTGYAMIVGRTTWSAAGNDDDMTVTRMVASDEIFANTFGTSSSD